MDVRIIAATNRDLEKLMQKSQFREDLYYRLKVVTIHLPPLRERSGDIPLLAEYFLSRFSKELGIDNPGITQAAVVLLNESLWPGNVREMANILQKALIFNRGAPLGLDDIAEIIRSGGDLKDVACASVESEIRKWFRDALKGNTGKNLFDSCMNRFAGILIHEALVHTGGNRSRAAELLGLSRPTLHSKIDKHRIKFETSVTKNR